MKKTRKPRTLKLSRETLYHLDTRKLGGVPGGASAAACNTNTTCPTHTLCPNTVCLLCTA